MFLKAYNGGGLTITMAIKLCKNCEKNFKIKSLKRKYCSLFCYHDFIKNSDGIRKDVVSEKVIEFYCQKKFSLRKCSEIFNCDRDVIKRILYKNKKIIRSQSEEKKLHPINYWLGKNRLDIWNKGKKLPQFSKENNPNWKGGKLGDEKDRKSVDMIKWRLFVYERDEFTCQECYIKGGKLEAHHIYPYKKYPSLRFKIENGITLCRGCHRKVRNKEHDYIQYFSDKLENGVNSGKVQNGQSRAKSRDCERLLKGVTVRTEETIMSTSSPLERDDMT